MNYPLVLPCLALAMSSSALHSAILHWDNGATDNVGWHVAENWAGDTLVGSVAGQAAIFHGTGDAPHVVQPVTPLNPTDITVRAESIFTISADLTNIDDFLLGPNANVGGGHVKHDAGVLSAKKISVGNSLSAISDSSYELSGTAELVTTADLIARIGSILIHGSEVIVNVGNNLDLSLGGDLEFVLGEYGAASIDIANTLKVNATSSTLTIDGSDYRGGSATIELIRFSSLSNSFAAGNIIATGFGDNQSVVVVQGPNSIDLEINTSVASDSESQFWFSMTPNAGTNDASADDIYLNNEHSASTLGVSNGFALQGSPYLACVQSSDGNDLIYSIAWTGNDYDKDGNADTFSFDLRVRAYTGATYSYTTTENASSVSFLGSTGDATLENGRIGVGSDADLDAGESLEFTVENVSVSVAGFVGEVNGFTAFGLNEKGGHSHSHIRGAGVGTELASAKINYPQNYSVDSADPFVVTSAGSATTFGFQVDFVNFGIKVYDPSATPSWDVSDYSFSPDGLAYVEPYPAQTGNVSFPSFSWDTVPRWLAVRNQNAYSQGQLDSIANNYQLVMLEKSNQNGLSSTEEGIAKMAADLKAVSTEIKVLAYWNSLMLYLDYAASDSYDIANWSETAVDVDGNVSFVLQRGELYRYERSLSDVRDWWVNSALGMVNDANVDGLFIDVPTIGNSYFYDQAGNPTTDNAVMFDDLRTSMPASKMLVGNALRTEHDNGGRELMECFDASYLERWDFIDRDSLYNQTEADVFVNSIQLMREALSLGKMINLQSGPDGPDIDSNPVVGGSANMAVREAYAQDWVDFPLAVFLIIAEPNAYFGYNMGVNAIEESYNDDVWDTSFIDQFNRPLGAPLADPTRDGYVYNRSYEHADVWLDVSTKDANILWKNDIGSPFHSGTAVSNSDGTYMIEGGGADIWSTSDQFFYLSEQHTGDSELIARIDSQENTHTWAKTGVMFRESLDANSANVFVYMRSDKQVALQYRSATGATSQRSDLSGDTSNAKWVKLVRSGDVFTGYYSVDGVTWLLLDSQTIPMPDDIEAGLAVTSHKNSTLSTVTFSNVSIED